MTASSEMTALARAVSRLLGWTYFLCWSCSFYPQVIINYKRQSTQGLAIDFPTLNLLGFTCYTISTFAFLYSSTIREQYAKRHPVSPETTVRFNDFAFALHAVFMCVIGYSQFWPALWGFNVGLRQRVSRTAMSLVVGSVTVILGSVFYAAFITPTGGHDAEDWAWIDVVYVFGYIKLLCSVTKYCPQAYFNYKRKSTAGWNITQILLDFSGGILSMLQLLIDSALQADWSGLTGNPVKFGLSNTSLFFDAIFMAQHYVLYRPEDQPDHLNTAHEWSYDGNESLVR